MTAQKAWRLAQDVVTMLGLSAICWYLGADAWHSILIAGVVTVVARAASMVSQPAAKDSRWDEYRRARAKGGRSDVTTLAWSLRGGWGRAGPTAERRVVEIAQRRLALHHLDLKNPDHRPQIEQLVGRRAYRCLTRSAGRGLWMRSLLHCLDVLETVDPAPRRLHDQ